MKRNMVPRKLGGGSADIDAVPVAHGNRGLGGGA